MSAHFAGRFLGRLPASLPASQSSSELAELAAESMLGSRNREFRQAMLEGNLERIRAIFTGSPSQRPTPCTFQDVTQQAFMRGMHYADAMAAEIPHEVALRLQRIRSIAEFLRNQPLQLLPVQQKSQVTVLTPL